MPEKCCQTCAFLVPDERVPAYAICMWTPPAIALPKTNYGISVAKALDNKDKYLRWHSVGFVEGTIDSCTLFGVPKAGTDCPVWEPKKEQA